MSNSLYSSVGGSPLPTATNQNVTTPFILPAGLYSWVGTATTNTLTLPASIGVNSQTVITASVQVDDQQGSGTCWLISATPGTNTITFTLAASPTASSTLVIAWSVHKV